MKSRLLSAILSICSALCVGAIAVITPSAHSQPDPTVPSVNVLKSLNLSDSQRQQIRTILEKDREERRNDFQELRTKEQELRTMMDGNSPKEALVQKFNQIQTLRRQNAQFRFEQMLAVREILTPSQRSQLSKAAAEANNQQRRQRRFSRPNNPEN